MGPHTAGRVPTAAFSAVYPVHCTKMTALSDKIAQNWGEYLQTLLKARKIRIFSGRVCIVITILHLQPSPLCICTSPFSLLHHAIIKYCSYPPKSNFEKSKIKFQSMQLCKYKSTKNGFQTNDSNFTKTSTIITLKRVNTKNPRNTQNIYSLLL